MSIFTTRAACESGTGSVKDEEFEAGSNLNLPAYVDHGSPALVKVQEPAYCSDGSRAQLAFYRDVGCAGGHHHRGTHDHDAVLTDITDEEGQQCHDVTDYMAVAFTCSRLGKMPPHSGHSRTEKASWSLVVVSLVVLSILGFSLTGLILARGTDGIVQMLVSQLSLLLSALKLTSYI
jgi:hypothetical protein